MREIGIDEAGKGSVIGAMFVAGVLNFEGIEKLGVRDSKKLSASKREYLAGRIEEATQCVVLEISAGEIDALREKHTINEVIVELFSEVLRRFQPNRAFVDSVDVNPLKFASNLLLKYEKDIKIISEHKADEHYPLVSAASIVAKVHRDTYMQELEKEIGEKIGSGYPSDPVTIKFIERIIKERKEIPPYVRQSWRTVERLYKKQEISIRNSRKYWKIKR